MTRQQLGQAQSGDTALRQAQHRLEAPVAAHQHAGAQVGDAGGGALENGGHLAQQLLAAALALLLVGDVEGDDRSRLLARRQRRRLDPRHQPALAELGVPDRVAHLGPLGSLQGQLQPLVLGQRFGRDDVATDVVRHRRGRAAAAALADPARRFLEGGDADAGGVHEGTDLQVRQVALFFDAAVFDDAHEAALARRGLVAAHDRAQAPGAAAGLGHPALRFDRTRARVQARQRIALAPRQQPGQAGRAFGERHRHAARELVEGRVGADQQAALVEQHHADRAQVEPVVELAHRAVGTIARHVLGRRVLQHGQIERRAVRADQHVAGGAKPALEARRVEQAALGTVGHLDARAGVDALAVLDRRQPVFLGQEVGEVAADDGFAGQPDEGGEGGIDIDEEEGLVLQRSRKGRVPEQPENLVHGGRAGRGRMQGATGNGVHRRRALVATRAQRRPAGRAAGHD